MGRFVTTAFAIALAIGLAATQPTAPVNDDPDDHPWLVVLGVAQDGGVPQAGCKRDCCADPGNRKHVACIGIVDPATGERWIIDATPDFPAQLRMLDEIAPPPDDVTSPALAGILLTHAHIGHYTGLMHVGHEVMGARDVPVWAMPRMRAYLSSNGPWSQLVEYGNIELRELADGEPVRLNSRITVTPILVPHRDEHSETVGFRIDGPGRSAFYLPDIDKWDRWDRRIEDVIAAVDAVWIDGTFYSDGELADRSMVDIAHPFIVESMQRLRLLSLSERDKVHFIHLNHTNPVLRSDSEARKAVTAAGFHVAAEGDRFVLAAGGQATAPTSRPTTRPAGADDFDPAGSDPRAVAIADAVMKRLGGRQAWDDTRYITWKFGGRRRHLWDKHTGRLRLERPGPRSGKSYVMLVDLDTATGRAWREGELVIEPGELGSMMRAARSEWINDAYWLVMPYKLKDAGVTLRYVGEGVTQAGTAAEVLQLTFRDAGNTPDNKYYVWVGDDSGLVEQWAFFGNAADEEPSFVTPWTGWKRYGRIMLSGDRGELRGRPFELVDIAVFDELPESFMTDPAPIDWEKLLRGRR